MLVLCHILCLFLTYFLNYAMEILYLCYHCLDLQSTESVGELRDNSQKKCYSSALDKHFRIMILQHLAMFPIPVYVSANFVFFSLYSKATFLLTFMQRDS